jgi:hypothetical protein
VPPAGVPSAGGLAAGAVGDGDAVAGGLVDSPVVRGGSPDARPEDSPEAEVVADPALDGSAGAVVVDVVDDSLDADGATAPAVDCWADANGDVSAGELPAGASAPGAVGTWIDVPSAPAARAGSSDGRAFRKRSAAGATGPMPSRTAHEVTRSLAASSEFSMLSAAFSRCNTASCSSARPMPPLSFSNPSCSVTIPIKANATRAIQVRAPSVRRRERLPSAASRPRARPFSRFARLRAGRSSIFRAGPETRRGLRGTVSGGAGAAVRRGSTAGAAAVAPALTTHPRSRSASWRLAAAPRRRADCGRSPRRMARSSGA